MAFWISGVVLWFFPDYAELTGTVGDGIFLAASLVSYGFGLLGLVVGISRLTRSAFTTEAVFAVGFFGGGALLLHYVAAAVTNPWQLILRLVLLVFVLFGIFGFAKAIPHLFNDDLDETGEQGGNTAEKNRMKDDADAPVARESTGQHALAITIAILTLGTALIQLFTAWMNY